MLLSLPPLRYTPILLAALLACAPSTTLWSSDAIEPLEPTDRPDTGVILQRVPDTGDAEVPAAPDPEAPALLLNEVVATNDSSWAGPAGDWPDWVELYNASDEAIALDRVALRDGSGLVWVGSEGVVEPAAHLVLSANQVMGPLSTPFALDADGEERLTVEVDGYVSDRLAIGKLERDLALARFPDGEAWGVTALTTPGAANPDTPSPTLDRTELVFQLDEIVPIDITLSADAVASLRASRLTWVDGSITVPEGDFGDVQVRLKAYVGSSRTIDQKCGFKVDLNEYSGRRWRGIETLTLNNMVQDPTYVHEYLAYQLFRAMGVPAPRVGYARVSVNGEDYGLYLAIETIDDRFLERWYGNASGALFEGAYGVDFYSYYVNSFSYDEGPDPLDYSAVSAVVSILDAGATEANLVELEKIWDMDEFLAVMAVEAVSLHWDGYTTANNYRVYLNPDTGRFQMIPWGTDQTFLSAWYYPWSAGGRIFEWCMEVSSCADRYDEKLQEAVTTMEALDLDGQATELAAQLRGDISTDPRREFDIYYHDYYLSATVSTIQTWPATVQSLLDAR